MPLVELNRNPSPRDLAWFGIAVLAALGVVGAILQFKFGLTTAARVVWGIGAAVCLVYYAVPPVRRTIFVAWMIMVYPIGWIVSHAVLGLIYYGIVTPVGLLMRLVGRDPMTRRFDRSATTYWITRPERSDPRRYFKQY